MRNLMSRSRVSRFKCKSSASRAKAALKQSRATSPETRAALRGPATGRVLQSPLAGGNVWRSITRPMQRPIRAFRIALRSNKRPPQPAATR